jgi:hypothetical protein
MTHHSTYVDQNGLTEIRQISMPINKGSALPIILNMD